MESQKFNNLRKASIHKPKSSNESGGRFNQEKEQRFQGTMFEDPSKPDNPSSHLPALSSIPSRVIKDQQSKGFTSNSDMSIEETTKFQKKPSKEKCPTIEEEKGEVQSQDAQNSTKGGQTRNDSHKISKITKDSPNWSDSSKWRKYDENNRKRYQNDHPKDHDHRRKDQGYSTKKIKRSRRNNRNNNRNRYHGRHRKRERRQDGWNNRDSKERSFKRYKEDRSRSSRGNDDNRHSRRSNNRDNGTYQRNVDNNLAESKQLWKNSTKLNHQSNREKKCDQDYGRPEIESKNTYPIPSSKSLSHRDKNQSDGN